MSLDVTLTNTVNGSEVIWHSERTDETAAVRQAQIEAAERFGIKTDAVRAWFTTTVQPCAH